MADAVMTGDNQLLVLRPEIWSALFYDTLLESLPFNAIVARDYQGDIQALGDRVHITEFPQFDEAEDIAEDQRVDADDITALQINLIINHEVVKDYIVTDRAKVQTIEHEAALRNLVFHSIMKKMQTILIADTVPSPAAPDHSIAYDSGTTLALIDILAAKELLDNANVADDGTRCMILDSPQWNDIFNITGLTSRDFIAAGSPLQEGSLPAQVLGFNPKMTTEANDVAFFFHPSYMQLAVQRDLLVKSFDLGVDGKRAMRVNSTFLFGNVQADDIRVVTVS